MRHVPAHAQDDDSYEVCEDMQAPDGQTVYYRQVKPSPPVAIDRSTPGEFVITAKQESP
jgi:hypothetical protein